MVIALAGVSYAAVEVKSGGTTIGKAETLNFTNGPTITKSGNKATLNFGAQTGDQTITGDSTITGDLTVTGDIVDVAVYSNSSGAYPTRPLGMGADGTTYGTGTAMVIDAAAIGSTTPDTGAFTTLTASGAADLASSLAVGTGDAFTVSAAGVIVDAAIYTKTTTLATQLVRTSVDGAIYGKSTGLIVDVGLYSQTTKGAGGDRTLGITADGVIYAF